MTTLVVKVLGTISGGQAMDLLFNIVFSWVSGLLVFTVADDASSAKTVEASRGWILCRLQQ
jgi:hypothetical protein